MTDREYTERKFIAMYGEDFGRGLIEALRNTKKRAYKTYVLKDSATHMVKIGRATDPHKRLSQLSVANINLVMVAICDRNVEKNLHDHFQSHKVNREWYLIPSENLLKVLNDYGFEMQ